MSEEARRVFKMETVLSLVANKGGSDVTGLVSYLVSRDVTPEDEAIAAPLCKAWLFHLLPSLIEAKFPENGIWDDFVKKESSRIGDNVSVTPIDDAELATVNVVLDTVATQKQTIAEQSAKIDDLEGQVNELEPFRGKSEELEKKVAGLEEKVSGLESENADLKKQTKEFEGKLAVDESGLNKTVQDIVSKAIKDACAVLPAAGAAGAVAAEGAAEPAPFDDGAAGAGESAPADDFGFGSAGADDGFGF